MRAILLLLAMLVAWPADAQSRRRLLLAKKPTAAASCPSMEFRGIGELSTTTGATSYSLTTSNNPSANALVLVVVINTKASTPDTPTLTGHGMTWVQVETLLFNPLSGGLTRMTVFRSMTNNTPTGTAIVADFAGATQTGCNMRAIQCGGNVDNTGTYGSGAIYQVVTNYADATANPTITLGILDQDFDNSVVAFFANDRNGFAATPETDWTEDWDAGYNTPATGGYCTYRLSTNDNTVAITSAAADWAGIAIEVNGTNCSPPTFTSPTNLPTLGRWFDADYLTYAQDTAIGSTALWTNRAHAGNDLTQTTSGFRPLFKTNILNGRPGVLFDGTDDELTMNSIGTMQKFSIFLVEKITTTPSTLTMGLMDDSGGSSEFWFQQTAGGLVGSRLTDGDNTTGDSLNYNSSLDAARLITITGQAGEVRFYQNGTNFGTNINFGQLKFDLNRVGHVAGNQFQGYQFESFIYTNYVASPLQVQQSWDNYISNKWFPELVMPSVVSVFGTNASVASGQFTNSLSASSTLLVMSVQTFAGNYTTVAATNHSTHVGDGEMTLLTRTNSVNSNEYLSLYYLLNPPTGSIEISFKAGGNLFPTFLVTGLHNNNASPFNSNITLDYIGAVARPGATNTISSAVNELVMGWYGAAAWDGSSVINETASGQASVGKYFSGSGNYDNGVSTNAGAATTTIGYESPSAVQGLIMISVKP